MSKFGDEIETKEQINEKKAIKRSSSIKMLVVVILVIGIGVFIVSNLLFGGKKVEDNGTEISITDENVQILYEYVTYGVRGTRNDKFVKENYVTMNSFSNYEKFYYALQFATRGDFKDTGRVNSNNQKIYNISDELIKKYMQLFFGSMISYSTGSEITYPFSFKVNGYNVGVMNHNDSTGGFDTVFNSVQEDIKKTSIIDPYYGSLVSAKEYNDLSLVLEEKVIFTTVNESSGSYNVSVYRDYEKTLLIDQFNGLSKGQLMNKDIDASNYKEKATTIKYKFKVNNNVYYFDSSEVVSNEE